MSSRASRTNTSRGTARGTARGSARGDASARARGTGVKAGAGAGADGGDAVQSKARRLAELRGKLRLLKAMMAADPTNATTARRAAQLQYKIWQLTMAQTDVPGVKLAYELALSFSDNEKRPQLWFDAASVYIACVRCSLAPLPAGCVLAVG